MPYFLVDGESIYDRLRQPRFHLVAFSDADKAILKNCERNLKANTRDFVDFNGFSLSPEVAEAFGTDKSFSVLLRPDYYVGFISAETSSAELSVYLNKLVGRS